MGKRVRLIIPEQYYAVVVAEKFCAFTCPRLNETITGNGSSYRCAKFGALNQDRIVSMAVRHNDCLGGESRANGEIE